MRQIWEGRQEGTCVRRLHGVCVYPVSYERGCAIRSEAWVDERKGYSCDCPNFDIDYVISNSASIGESFSVPAYESQPVRAAPVGWYRHVEAQIIRLNASREVLESGHNSRRYACHEDGNKVCSRFAVPC